MQTHEKKGNGVMAAMFCLELASKLVVGIIPIGNSLPTLCGFCVCGLQHFERFHEAVRFYQRAIDLQVNVSVFV